MLSAIDGLEGNDTLTGSDRDDSLFGNFGNDCLIGAAGDDTLQGGEGLDTFAYLSRTQLSSGTTSDRIADFTAGSDRLVFDRNEFGFELIEGTPENQLSSEQFVTDPNIPNTLTSPILVYNQPDGILEYYPNGIGIESPETVAVFDGSPNLSADDILLVGTSTEPIAPVVANPDSATTPNSILGTEGPDTISPDDSYLGWNAIAIPVLDNDSPAGGLTINSLGTVVGGNATILEGGTAVQFIPTLLGETVGSFNYTASDSARNTASAPVTVTISAVTAVDGLGGDDILRGAESDDSLFGNTGNDTLQGGNGNDILEGGFGGDFLIGGDGNDTFLYRSVEEVQDNQTDSISDFDSDSDQVQFTEDFSGINLIGETDEIPVNESALIYAQTTGELRYVDESNNQFVIAAFSPLPDGSFPLLDDSSILIV
ncbi:MAG: calcium-binding protein [Limnospira sp.]